MSLTYIILKILLVWTSVPTQCLTWMLVQKDVPQGNQVWNKPKVQTCLKLEYLIQRLARCSYLFFILVLGLLGLMHIALKFPRLPVAFSVARYPG